MLTGNNIVNLVGYAQRVFDNGKIVAMTIGAYAGKDQEGKTKRDYIPCIFFPNDKSHMHRAILQDGGWVQNFEGKQVILQGKLIHGKSFNAKLNVEVWKTDVLIDTIAIHPVQAGTNDPTKAQATPVQPAGQSLPAMDDDLPF